MHTDVRGQGLTTARRRPRSVPAGPALALVLGLVVGLFAAGAVLAPPAAAVADSTGLQWRATVGGQDVTTATGNSPVRLDPDAGTVVVLEVRNTGSTPVVVRASRLEGRVIGLPFYSYKTWLDLELAPGQAGQRSFGLDLSDLGDQATGLIPSRLQLLGDDRQVFGTQSLVVDVRGQAFSVYGLFGILVGVFTGLVVAGLAFSVARRRLPDNRWQRAVRFVPAGVGLGFTATFTLSALRLLSPSASAWVPLVLACAAVAFLLGYLSPGPDGEHPDGEAHAAESDRTGSPRGRRAAVVAAGAVGAGAASEYVTLPDDGAPADPTHADPTTAGGGYPDQAYPDQVLEVPQARSESQP